MSYDVTLSDGTVIATADPVQVDALLRDLAPAIAIQIRNATTGEILTGALVQLEAQKQPLSLSYVEDTDLTFSFALQGQDSDATIDFGDGHTALWSKDTPSFTYVYAEAGTYRVYV